jgi:hypothetical protein
MTTAHKRADVERALEAFLRRKYVCRADARQAEMGLSYLTAEVADLARETAHFVAQQRCDLCGGTGEIEVRVDGWVKCPNCAALRTSPEQSGPDREAIAGASYEYHSDGTWAELRERANRTGQTWPTPVAEKHYGLADRILALPAPPPSPTFVDPLSGAVLGTSFAEINAKHTNDLIDELEADIAPAPPPSTPASVPEELRALSEKATQLPADLGAVYSGSDELLRTHGFITIGDECDVTIEGTDAPANAAFLHACWNHVRSLLGGDHGER